MLKSKEKPVTWVQSFYKSCTFCRKCCICCPAKINIPEAIEIYEEYLAGNIQILEKINRMESEGTPLDCIECGACSAHCPQGINAKKIIRELAMMQSCRRLIPLKYSN